MTAPSSGQRKGAVPDTLLHQSPTGMEDSVAGVKKLQNRYQALANRRHSFLHAIVYYYSSKLTVT